MYCLNCTSAMFWSSSNLMLIPFAEMPVSTSKGSGIDIRPRFRSTRARAMWLHQSFVQQSTTQISLARISFRIISHGRVTFQTNAGCEVCLYIRKATKRSPNGSNFEGGSYGTFHAIEHNPRHGEQGDLGHTQLASKLWHSSEYYLLWKHCCHGQWLQCLTELLGRV